jgi:hypothetical protein
MAGWAAVFAAAGAQAAAVGFGATGAAATLGQLLLFPTRVATLVALVLCLTRPAAR